MIKKIIVLQLIFSLFFVNITLAAGKINESKIKQLAEHWITSIDNEQYSISWKKSAAIFKEKITADEWRKAMIKYRKPLGKKVSRRILSTQNITELPGIPDGDYYIIQYQSSFKNKKSATETLTLMLEKDNGWRVAGYYIK